MLRIANNFFLTLTRCRYLMQPTFVTGLLCALPQTTRPVPRAMEDEPKHKSTPTYFQTLYHRGPQTVLVKIHTVNTLDFVGHTLVSVTTLSSATVAWTQAQTTRPGRGVAAWEQNFISKPRSRAVDRNLPTPALKHIKSPEYQTQREKKKQPKFTIFFFETSNFFQSWLWRHELMPLTRCKHSFSVRGFY